MLWRHSAPQQRHLIRSFNSSTQIENRFAGANEAVGSKYPYRVLRPNLKLYIGPLVFLLCVILDMNPGHLENHCSRWIDRIRLSA